MARTRRYHPLVADDLAAAIAYFDDISVDLGSSFRTSVRRRIESIADRPDSFGCIHKQIRAAMVDRFPYVILFESDKETVAILGIFHAASDRERWLERTA
jgi:plasmid stabilization system protein ParE